MSASPKPKVPSPQAKPQAAPALAQPSSVKPSTGSSATAFQVQPAMPTLETGNDFEQDLASLHKLEKLGDPLVAKKAKQVMARIKARVEAKAKTEAEGKPDPGRCLGVLSKCYLGCGHDVHLMDLDQEIMKHFKTTEGLPAGFEKVRDLAATSKPGIVGYMVFETKILILQSNGDTDEL